MMEGSHASFSDCAKKNALFCPLGKMTKPFIGEKHTLEGKKICYSIQKEKEYANHLEMAGFYAASIISYGADSSGNLRIMRHVAFPSLRMYPNLTGSHLDYNFKGNHLFDQSKTGAGKGDSV